MKRKNAVKKSGFTLLELLIVILIIGLLSAISIPMYKKAVEKSKVADALSTMQAVSKSEHGWYLVRNNYTKDFANLDIDLYDKDGNKAEDESFDSINYTFTLQDNSIKADRNNGEYTLYKMYEDPNNYCLPQENEICQQFGWGVNRTLCNNIEGSWSSIKNHCYSNPQERCIAHDMPYKNNLCGWQGDKWYNQMIITSMTINEGGVCTPGNASNRDYKCDYSIINSGGVCKGGYYGGCNYSTVNAGGICDTSGRDSACNNVTVKSGGKCLHSGTLNNSCNGITVEEGGVCETAGGIACIGEFNGGTCISGTYQYGGGCSAYWGGQVSNFHDKATCIGNGPSACSNGRMGGQTNFKDGSKCVANVSNTCNANYESGSCCQSKEGYNYCPASAPKCNCPRNADGSYPKSC